MTAPMAGVRVLEVATHVFVPSAASVLAEWGAEVVKVEHPVTGDPYRGLVIHGLHGTYKGLDVNFQLANRGKRSVGLDLKHPDGRALLERLVRESDVFLTNLRPSARRLLRIDVDDLRAVNPSLVYVRGSGQGPRGPHAERAGYDIAAYWSRSGVSALLKPPDAEWPSFPPPAFGDLASGPALAGAVAAALYQRATTGEAPVVDLSLLAMGMWQIQPAIVDRAVRGAPPTAGLTAGRYEMWNPLVQHYRTRDDRFIALVMVDADRHWTALCERLGVSELADDPRFADLEARKANSRACVEALEVVFAARDHDEWCRVLDDFSGAWAPVQDPAELPHDAQVQANGYLGTIDLDDGRGGGDDGGGGGDGLPMVTSPVQFDERPGEPRRPPEHGQHTEEVLLELGLTWDEITALKDAGAIL